ncbi:MAG: hypothetical protein WAN47_11075 [Nitrosotalea sp.]
MKDDTLQLEIISNQDLISDSSNQNLLERKKFKLNLPYREILSTDISHDFDNELLSAKNITLQKLYIENKDNYHVWVFESDSKILAFLSFVDEGDHFHIDMIAVNRIHDKLCDEIHPGYSLFTLLELVSLQFGYSKITLNSVQNRIGYWKSNGYEIIGPSEFSNVWGMLTPMEKKF